MGDFRDEELLTVQQLEMLLLEPLQRADVPLLERMLHPEFAEFGSSGRHWNRVDMIEALAADPSVVGVAEDFTATRLTADVVLVTYRVVGSQVTLRSSVWLRDGQTWQLRFHQATVVPG